MHKIDHIQVNLIQIKLDFAEHIQNTDVQIADCLLYTSDAADE